MMYLENINGPKDIKELNDEQLRVLAGEIRSALLEKMSQYGGHFGPNFGMVEATIALHYVFDSPTDKMVFDVSHQSYTHKILTGRKEAFLNPEHYSDVTGYTEPKESEHDLFTIGHTSTSISMACGLAKARDLAGRHENVIAVIGDGSNCEITDSHIGSMDECHITVNTAKTPKILILQIGGVTVFVDLHCYLVAAGLKIRGDIKL